MKHAKKNVLNQEIEKEIEKITTALLESYPGQDVEMMIIQQLLKKRGTEIVHSEVDSFKKHAISTLGTDHEINFNDAEKGFLKAALADGRSGFKEFIESITVDTPLNEDGTKMINHGIQKKNIMTALGLVEGVKRTLYRDDALNESKYPLDDKIELLNINGERSRYTRVFAWNTARLYAELTENEAELTINALLGIDINKTQIAMVGQAVAEYYEKDKDDETAAKIPPAGIRKEDVEDINDKSCENTTTAAEGFLTDRLKELAARPDIEKLIQASIDGKLDGVESAEATRNVMYFSADGSGVPGLRRELSDKGKDGGKAGTFEAKIGCTFQQAFAMNGKPILTNGNIARIPNTTKYMGTTEKIDGFYPQFADFAFRYGITGAAQVVFLSDGALWLGGVQAKLCPKAIVIVDYFHAAEHLDDIIGQLRFHNTSKRAEFADVCCHLLESGEIEKLILLIRSKSNTKNSKTIDKKLVYFERNADKMRYGIFRAAGIFIGSGVIEAACKTIIGKRLKNAGMHWSKQNANFVITLRCNICSDEYDIPDDNSFAA